jgi:hypothetical protein
VHDNQWGEIDERLTKIERSLMAFADSLAKLSQDVHTLIAQNGPAAVAAAVAAKDAADAASLDALDAQVVAALPAPAPAPAPAPTTTPSA